MFMLLVFYIGVYSLARKCKMYKKKIIAEFYIVINSDRVKNRVLEGVTNIFNIRFRINTQRL